jgi:hypothetical protein
MSASSSTIPVPPSNIAMLTCRDHRKAHLLDIDILGKMTIKVYSLLSCLFWLTLFGSVLDWKVRR